MLVVGRQGRWVAEWFERCEIVGALDDGVGVDNEEQGVPLTLCDGPTAPWDEIWADVRHLD